MRRAAVFIFISLLSGCAFTTEGKCRSWQRHGYSMGTIPSCIQCIETLGDQNPESVGACSLGLDAGKILDSIR